MCAPDFYGIEYEINPWMSRSRQANRERAVGQWRRLCDVLRTELGVEIDLLEPRPGLPDMVFTANAGVVWNGKFIAANFRHEVRQGEVPHYQAWFEQRGYEIVRLPAQFYFEGEGDLLRGDDIWFAGYRIRSDISSHGTIAEIVAQEILSLELTNSWFYHLDTCFCPLPDGRAFCYPGAFDGYGLRVLADRIPELITVSEAEAKRFACNAIVQGNLIVMNDGCPKLRRTLEERGYTVFETPLDEFIKAGGSAKCLALIIG
jgi:N-dimethylarginine dimethylaminohydrolase